MTPRQPANCWSKRQPGAEPPSNHVQGYDLELWLISTSLSLLCTGDFQRYGLPVHAPLFQLKTAITR
ncbi:MAG: hypothetical protein ACM3PY_22015 [Omnitrophica WOR_2 bacterium]